jgi:hypothetical protein
VLEANHIDARLPKPEETLYEYFYDRTVDFRDRLNRPLVPVLMFDQFEEIFTLGRADENWRRCSDHFFLELAAVVEGVHTKPVLERFSENPAVPRMCDFYRRNFRVLLSLREDFLPYLADRDDILPSALRQVMRLEELSQEQALEAVLKSGGHLMGPDVADRIVGFVAGSSHRDDVGTRRSKRLIRRGVDPSILSLLCTQLNEERKQRQKRTGRPERIEVQHLSAEHASSIIERYYHETVESLPALRKFIEDHLLTRDGHRVALPETDLLAVPGVSSDGVYRLVRERRILRRELEEGVAWIRLSHDRIAAVAKAAKAQRELKEQKLAAERGEQEARQRQEEAEKRQKEAEEAQLKAERRERLARRRLSQVVTLAVLAIVLLLVVLKRLDVKFNLNGGMEAAEHVSQEED